MRFLSANEATGPSSGQLIVSRVTKKFMIWLNAKPTGYMLKLDARTNHGMPEIAKQILRMRQMYLPNKVFYRVVIMRSISREVVLELMKRETGMYMLLWRKRDSRGEKVAFLHSVADLNWNNIVCSEWSAVLYHDKDDSAKAGPKHDKQAESPRAMSIDLRRG